jgi:hypothetical protein
MSNALMSIFYDRKYILTGNIVEVIEYEKPVLKQLGERAEGSNSGRSVDASEVDQERHRKDTLQRARAKVRRLINANAYQWFNEKGKAYKPVFLTLTYADNMTDVSQGNKDLRGFIKRLSYMVHGGQEGCLKYLAVPEFQERGAVHYHLVIFNLPYTDKELIASRWGHGFIDIRLIDQVTNVGAYISKYMTKTEDERLKGRRCFLSSSTTRRAGLVSNSDFLPAVMAFLGDKPKPVMKTTPGTDHSLQALDQKLAFLIRLRQQRGVLHLIFIFFAVLTIAGGYWVHICKQEKGSRVLSLLLLTTLSMPLVILCLSLFGYRSIGLSACLLIGLSILAGVTLYYVFGSNLLPAVLWLSFATMLAITADAFLGSPLMINSALGSDSIAGGRFYGIGNDYMGILLASSIVSITLLISSLRMKPLTKALLGLVPLGIVTTAIGHPHYGANMGGLITGIVMLGFFYLVIMEIRLTPKRLVLIGLTALAGVLAVARLDALFSANPSHAGQAITNLFSGGWTALFSIIKIKQGILGNTVYHSPWSLVLLLSVIFLASSWIRHQQTLGDVLRQFPAVQKAGNLLLLTAVTVFLVNDTGVIAAALIFLYLCSLLWAALAQNRLKKESGGDRL